MESTDPSQTTPIFHTCASLREDLEKLGLKEGDMVMVHAAVSRVGRMLHGPDALIAALTSTVGSAGTVVAYTDWDGAYEELLDSEGRVPPSWRPLIPGFNPVTSRATRDNGILPEFIRTTPGARRSGNPGASVAAIGGRAEWLTSDHPLNYGYGERSPLAKLVEARGKVLMLGAPLDTMTLLHHAEHLAQVPGKRLKSYEVPLATPTGTTWVYAEEFDTADPVISGLEDNYFGEIVRQYLASGRGEEGLIGEAPSVLVDATDMCAFGVNWLEKFVA